MQRGFCISTNENGFNGKNAVSGLFGMSHQKILSWGSELVSFLWFALLQQTAHLSAFTDKSNYYSRRKWYITLQDWTKIEVARINLVARLSVNFPKMETGSWQSHWKFIFDFAYFALFWHTRLHSLATSTPMSYDFNQ